MGILELFLQTSSPTPLLGALLVLLLVYLVSSSSFSSEKNGKEPPGPRPLPLLGNLLQLDFKRVYISLAKVKEVAGSFFVSAVYCFASRENVIRSITISTFSFVFVSKQISLMYAAVLSFPRNMDQSSPSTLDLLNW